MSETKLSYNKLEKRNKILLFGFSFFIITSLFLVGMIGFYYDGKIYTLEQENLLFKTILYADSQVLEISITSQKAESYYSEAGFFYEDGDFKNTESSCRLARDYFSDSSQNYREIRSELETSGIEDPLINIYSESLEVLAETKLNLFEACEYFETASRYYDKYYNTDVPFDDSSYDLGGNSIKSMNEKIELHDQNIRKYNDLLSDFKIELENKIN